MTIEQELLSAVRDTNKWLRILAAPVIRVQLRSVLDTEQKRAVYQESDGRQIREVASAAHAGFGTVQRHWQDWTAKGLMEATETPGRYRRIVSLDEVGLEGGD